MGLLSITAGARLSGVLVWIRSNAPVATYRANRPYTCQRVTERPAGTPVRYTRWWP